MSVTNQKHDEISVLHDFMLTYTKIQELQAELVRQRGKLEAAGVQLANAWFTNEANEEALLNEVNVVRFMGKLFEVILDIDGYNVHEVRELSSDVFVDLHKMVKGTFDE